MKIPDVITCPCGQKNRIPAAGPGARIVCGACKGLLATGGVAPAAAVQPFDDCDDDDENDDDFDDRDPGGDE